MCGGPATLSVSWAKSLLKCMNFTKRQNLVPSQDVEEVCKEFLSKLMEAVELHEVPPDLIFNWDQTGILLVPSAQWTMDKKGWKKVPIAGHNDKRQITAVMCGAHWRDTTDLTCPQRYDQKMSPTSQFSW